MITLSDFAVAYFEARRVSPTYSATVMRRAAALQLHVGESSIDRVLTEPAVNSFLHGLDLSPYTVRSYRSDFLSLWNGAADLDLLPYPVMRRIWRPVAPALIVECYTVDEVRALLGAVKRIQGDYPNGISKRAYWSAIIRLAWDGGLRRGDCLRFNRQHLRPDGTLRVVQSKTGQIVTVRLRPSTVAAIDKIGGKLRWPLDPSFFGRHFKRIVREAGVCRGTFKWLRRASGSYVEAQQPGSGHKHLGNGPGVFDRNYDAKLGGATWPMPPALD